MNQTIQEGYLGWLVSHVSESERYSRSHWGLLSQLHEKPFRWYVFNDENRNTDGQNLRDEFLNSYSIYEADEPWLTFPASMLEMLIALSRRVAYISYGSPSEWFWKMLTNAGLEQFTDGIHHNNEGEVDLILEKILERTYKRNGLGGFFPLRAADQDQRIVELWYQANAYVLEGNDAASGPPLT